MICIAATAIWSTTAVLIRYLTESYQTPPLVLAFWRDLFVFLGLASVFLLFNRKSFKINIRDLKFFLIYGFVLSAFNSLWTVSVAINGAAVSTVLAYSSPAFTALLGWWIFSEQLGVVKIIAVILSILGCLFISGAYDIDAWQVNAVGILTGLLSGMAFAGYSLMGRASYHRNINPWTTLLYTFGIASLFILFYNLVLFRSFAEISSTQLFWFDGMWLGWFLLILLALGPTVGGYGLYTVSLTYLPASVANLIATLEPAMTAVLAYILLEERFSNAQIFGSVLIVSGILLLRLNERRLLSKERKTSSILGV